MDADAPLPRVPPPDGITTLERFTVKPGHLDAWLTLWPDAVAARRACGFTLHRAFVETDAEPKVTALWSHPDHVRGVAELATDPAAQAVARASEPHVFGNRVERPVRVELLTEPDAAGAARTVVMRRYSIVGGWAEFLGIWRRIVPVRERHGFRVLFAVSDEPHDLFTWAFDFDGAWDDFGAAQRDYYRDPERVELRGVFDHMADYALHPARPLPTP